MVGRRPGLLEQCEDDLDSWSNVKREQTLLPHPELLPPKLLYPIFCTHNPQTFCTPFIVDLWGHPCPNFWGCSHMAVFPVSVVGVTFWLGLALHVALLMVWNFGLQLGSGGVFFPTPSSVLLPDAGARI